MSRERAGSGVWHKSSHSNWQANCVEVLDLPKDVAVRDSNTPAGPVLICAREAMGVFLTGVASGHWVPAPRTYYAVCVAPGEEDGTQMLVTLAPAGLGPHAMPGSLPDVLCIDPDCPNGGAHDLLWISDAMAVEFWNVED